MDDHGNCHEPWTHVVTPKAQTSLVCLVIDETFDTSMLIHIAQCYPPESDYACHPETKSHLPAYAVSRELE